MKYFWFAIFGIFLSLMGILTVHAGIVEKSFWIDPSTFAGGEKVTLNALIRNDNQSTVTYTVDFYDNEKKIGQKEITIDQGVTRPISLVWTTAKGVHELEVRVQKAIDAKGRIVENAQVQTVHVLKVTSTDTPKENQGADFIPENIKAKGLSFFNKIDEWRLTQLASFTQKRNTLKASIDNVENSVVEEASKDTSEDMQPINKLGTIFDGAESPTTYLLYVMYLLLVFIFASTFLFYGLAALLTFLMLKFLVSRFI